MWKRDQEWAGGDAGHKISVRGYERAAVLDLATQNRRARERREHRLMAGGISNRGGRMLRDGEALIPIENSPGIVNKAAGIALWRAMLKGAHFPDSESPTGLALDPGNDERYNPALLSRADRRRGFKHRGPLVGEKRGPLWQTA